MPTTNSTNWKRNIAQIAVTEHRIANDNIDILIGLIDAQIKYIKTVPNAEYQGDKAATILVQQINDALHEWHIAMPANKQFEWQQSVNQTITNLSENAEAIILQCLQFPNYVNYLTNINWDNVIAHASNHIGPVADFAIAMYDIEQRFSNLALH